MQTSNFDLVLQGKDGSVTIVLDGKQLAESGAVKLSTSGAGGTNQLSLEWVNNVVRKLGENSPAAQAILRARDNNSLMMAVGGVNRTTGELLVFPVSVANKTPAIPL